MLDIPPVNLINSRRPHLLIHLSFSTPSPQAAAHSAKLRGVGGVQGGEGGGSGLGGGE